MFFYKTQFYFYTGDGVLMTRAVTARKLQRNTNTTEKCFDDSFNQEQQILANANHKATAEQREAGKMFGKYYY
jgi:hypothetical protein